MRRVRLPHGRVTLPEMKILRGNEVDEGIPGDVRIVGIRWLNEANDVSIELEFPSSSGTAPHGKLLCTWATDVRMDMDLHGRIGTIPVWQHEVVKTDESWRVVFDTRTSTSSRQGASGPTSHGA